MRPLILSLLVISALYSNGQLCDPNTQCLYFDGNSCVSYNSNSDLDITEKISIEAWVKASSWVAAPLYGTIVSKHGWTLGERGYALRAGGNGQLSFVIAGIDEQGNDVGWQEVTSDPGALELNEWHHVAGVFDKKKLKIYVDGSMIKQVNFHGTIKPNAAYNIRIGRIADDGAPNGRYWFGCIDEVRIWKKSLSNLDVSSHADEHINANSPELVGYWRFNSGTGSSVTDEAGSCNGNIHNAMWNTDVPFTNGVLRPLITQVGNDLYSSALLNNQWNYNGVPIPGQTGISITPSFYGDYSVTAPDLLGCPATSLPYQFGITSLVDELEKNISILYNQSDQTITIQLKQEYRNATFRIIDNYGREIRSEKITSSLYNLNTYSAGIYHLVFNLDGQNYSKSVFCY